MKKDLIKKRSLIKEEEINKSEILTSLIKCVNGMAYQRNRDYKNPRKEERA
jgi:hypothetical protein